MRLNEALRKIDESPALEQPTARTSGIYPEPCIHGDGKTLCPDCQAGYDVDPEAYDEYGDHPAGLERWRALQEEIARDAATTPSQAVQDDSIPF